MSTKSAHKLAAARTGLILDQPFFGVLALRLRLKEDPGCGTAWTDGTFLGYDPAFVERLTADECKAVVAHEVMHCAMGHPWRRDARDGDTWNAAGDFEINGVLIDAGFTLPAERLYNPAYKGKSAEWIYPRLPKKQTGQGQGQDPNGNPAGCTHGNCSRDASSAPVSDGKGKAVERATAADWRQAVNQAANLAQGQGQLPAALRDFATRAVEPKVDWRSVLRRFVQSASAADYTWRSPSARYLGLGLYMPRLYSEDLGPIAVAVDTSGSCASVQGTFAAEIQAIVAEMSPRRLYVIYADAAVGQVDTFERGDVVEFAPVGGGGTDFRPAFDAVAALDEAPVCLIYLTDLEGTFPEAADVPTLWITPNREVAPFGETVHIAEE